MKSNYFKIFSLLAFGVFVVWASSALIMLNLDNRGEYGDMFGAVNSLFSGLAFAAFIVTLLMQKQELEDNRLELKRSADAQKKSASLSALTTLLNEYNLQLEKYHQEINSQEFNLNVNELYTERVFKNKSHYQSKKDKTITAIEEILKEEGFNINA